MTEPVVEATKKEARISIHKHESFALRKGWLHKGIRHVKNDDRLFTRSDSSEGSKPCDVLGIGTNMVKSMRYWLKATGLMKESKGSQVITELGEIINKYDPYFEERGTHYIIHHQLASNSEDATAWYWFFNEYSGSSIDKQLFVGEFTEYVRFRNCAIPASRVLESEFSCLMRTYCAKDDKDAESDPEETKICPLAELRLVTSDGKEYKKVTPERTDIHPLIAFAVICEKQAIINRKEQGNINLKQLQISELLYGKNNIGKIFNLDRASVFYLIEHMEQIGLISIVRTAGLDIINIKEDLSFIECVTKYYKGLGEAEYD